MKSRRDLLKFFGAGVLIAPIVGAKPDETTIAQLIEQPKIRPIELFPEIPKDLDIGKAKKVTIFIEMANGERRRITAEPQSGWGILGAADDQVELHFSGRRYSSPQSYSASLYCRRLV